MATSKIEQEFSFLGRSKKAEFIGEHIDVAPASAVAKYVEGYLFDVLNDVDNDEYIATYLRNKGWECKAPE